MPIVGDRQRFHNEDLVLSVSQAVDRAVWDEGKYEPFLDELCGDREYQKDAIRTALRYLLGGKYTDLRALARLNYQNNSTLQARYGSWSSIERQLQLPDQLAASLDLATGTGKSYVLYGVAAILLAEGAADRVLVLCPSTTIEAGLMDKFRELASRSTLRDLLPANAAVAAPRIINASETITESSICVENFHAVLEHVQSSIRDSLRGQGARTVVLNDEAHHVVNESATQVKRWKEFLTDPNFGFRCILGVSGTPYIDDDYFADVIYRYSLRQAMEEGYVKDIEYVADLPQTGDKDDKWRLIHARHEESKRKLVPKNLLPLTIVVTATIARCKDVGDFLRAFLMETEGIAREAADERVLVVHNGAPGVAKLPYVDTTSSVVEWIVSVSMLNEGWDVKRVFQIVPHEERAFNSKLLIAQVLGRGLRIPDGWRGARPVVTVFNHDAWAPRIRSLVDEILERERRLTSRVREDSPHHFDLHQIDYSLEPSSVVRPKNGAYNLFEKGYIDLPSDVALQEVNVELERAGSGQTHRWQATIVRRTYTPNEIAVTLYQRLEDEQDLDDPDPTMRTYYTDRYPIERLEQIVRDSLERRGMVEATDAIRQRFLAALGTLRRKATESVRYTPRIKHFYIVSTRSRPANSVSAAELRNQHTYYYTDDTLATLPDEQHEVFNEVTEQGIGFKVVSVTNSFDFKTPLNAAIADSEPERRFINNLLSKNNLASHGSWIKSTTGHFYEIDYSWKKNNHSKRSKFNPDFFIKIANSQRIIVVEIKGDEELTEPSEENRKKAEYATAHFERVNQLLEEKGEATRYKFTFLTPQSFTAFFTFLREGRIEEFRSDLDVRLAEGD